MTDESTRYGRYFQICLRCLCEASFMYCLWRLLTKPAGVKFCILPAANLGHHGHCQQYFLKLLEQSQCNNTVTHPYLFPFLTHTFCFLFTPNMHKRGIAMSQPDHNGHRIGWHTFHCPATGNWKERMEAQNGCRTALQLADTQWWGMRWVSDPFTAWSGAV